MNHLEQLKAKLMVKPSIKNRELVAVVLKGETKHKKQKADKDKKKEENANKSIGSELAEGIMDLGEQFSKIQQMEGILPTSISTEDDDEPDEIKTNYPIIIDKTKEGYDRQAFLKKLADNNLIKVTVKPIVEIAENTIEPSSAKPSYKKAKKMELLKPVIEEEKEEGEEEEEPFALKSKFTEEEMRNNKSAALDEEPPILPKKRIIIIKKKLAVKEGNKGTIDIEAPIEKKRKTNRPEKGVAGLNPEGTVEWSDNQLAQRLPQKRARINIKVPSYIMNNREIFVNFINSLFEPYKQELENNKESISCDTIGSKTDRDFSLLTHQKVVRDYMNLYTPYRGLLLYHGLGSGKTCTSIAIAEGMKDSKKIIIMTPASLRANYIEELKKCGDLLYKTNQFWEWISIDEHPEALKTMSNILNLPQEFIRKQGGAFFINIKKPSNYKTIKDENKKILDDQINEMIMQKYSFINYNGLRDKKLAEMTSDYTINIFDNAVIVIDEAHNFISLIVNKLKKEREIKENKRGEKERMPLSRHTKLYEMLLSAKNARIILLTGTPVINYPNEFGILFNILRGYIKTWKIPLVINTTEKIDRASLHLMFESSGDKSFDYVDYSPSSKILTITKNPFGFANMVGDKGYMGVSNNKKENEKTVLNTEILSDEDFEKKIIGILRRNNIDIVPDGITIKYRKALPDKFDDFTNKYVDDTTRQLKNTDSLTRRIIGLSSYFTSAQEGLLPKFNKELGVDYHVIKIEMSDVQFKNYESARVEERKAERKKPKQNIAGDYEDKSSTYRIFSRLFCNFSIPDRPIPIRIDKKDKKAAPVVVEEKDEEDVDDSDILNALKLGKDVEAKQYDGDNGREGEIEGDEILDAVGGIDYKERLKNKLKEMEDNADDFFTPEALETYSPKFLNILENIQDPAHAGLHLVYSQFRTAEGIGLFTLVLNKNGFTQFKIKKNTIGLWVIDIDAENEGLPTYALYTGTETTEEKEIMRKIYNGEWDKIPNSISTVLLQKYRNNNMGEAIKVFMITSSGSEGINLRNTRYVHLMDPYWHPVRSEQVIGRARRICSHQFLPKIFQTVEVFVYLMCFSPEQLKSDEAIELKRKDLSKSLPKVAITSDEYLFEISEIKSKLTNQLTSAIKQSSFDCYLYSNGKCLNFADTTIDKFSYVPDYDEQQNDIMVQSNKTAIEWRGKIGTFNKVKYVYRRINDELLYVYDLKSYQDALKDPTVVPVQIGSVEINKKGEEVFKTLIAK
jgi:hypothetical protein